MSKRGYSDAEKIAYYKKLAAGRVSTTRKAPGRRVQAPRSKPKSSRSTTYKYPGYGSKIGGALGSYAGNAIVPGAGGLVGGVLGSVVGGGAQALVKRVTGFGDYTVSRNSLMYNQDAVPEFSNSPRCTMISHREFIQDIKSSVGFVNQQFRINPGIVESFPWLAAIANNYEQYVVQGMVYEFKTTSATAIGSTNTSLGTVIMATQYNSLSPVFLNKQQMENYEFSQSTIPSQSILHPIECDPTQTQCGGIFNMYNPDDSNGDTRLYDVGRFNIATVGMQAADATVGELWVTYKICFLKPKLQAVSEVADQFVLDPGTTTSSNWLGDISLAQVRRTSSFVTTLVDSDTISISPSFVGVMQITMILETNADCTAITGPDITVSAQLEDVSYLYTVVPDVSRKTVLTATDAPSNLVVAIYYVKSRGGYIPSTGAPPTIVFSGGVLTGTSPLNVNDLQIMSVPPQFTVTSDEF